MTVGQLRDVLSEIKDKNLEVDNYINDIIKLGNRCFYIDSKIGETYNQPLIAKGWREAMDKAVDEIRNYQGK